MRHSIIWITADSDQLKQPKEKVSAFPLDYYETVQNLQTTCNLQNSVEHNTLHARADF